MPCPSPSFRVLSGRARGDGLTAAEAVAAWRTLRLCRASCATSRRSTPRTTLLGHAVAAPSAIAPTTLQRARRTQTARSRWRAARAAAGVADRGLQQRRASRSPTSPPPARPGGCRSTCLRTATLTEPLLARAPSRPVPRRWCSPSTPRSWAPSTTARADGLGGHRPSTACTPTTDTDVRRRDDRREGDGPRPGTTSAGWPRRPGSRRGQGRAAGRRCPPLRRGGRRRRSGSPTTAAGSSTGRSPRRRRCSSVVDAVGGAVEVYVDGGVRSGLDVLTALALGARRGVRGAAALCARWPAGGRRRHAVLDGPGRASWSRRCGWRAAPIGLGPTRLAANRIVSTRPAESAPLSQLQQTALTWVRCDRGHIDPI